MGEEFTLSNEEYTESADFGDISIQETEMVETEEETELQTEEVTEEVTEESQEIVYISPEQPELPVYDVDNPLPVILVEEEPEVFAVSGSPYPGTISTTYLDYFERTADALAHDVPYVAFRSDQYEYVMFYGEGITHTDGHFTGFGNYLKFDTRSGGTSNVALTRGTDSVDISVGTGVVYSNLGDYAMLTKGGTHLEFMAVLFALGFFVVYSVCHDIFDYIMHLGRK